MIPKQEPSATLIDYLVIGSVRMDITTMTSFPSNGQQRSAEMMLHAGGGAHQLALLLRAMDNQVSILTALNVSPWSMILCRHLQGQGVKLHVETLPSLPLAMGIHDQTRSAVLSEPVSTFLFSESVLQKTLNEPLGNASRRIVVMDETVMPQCRAMVHALTEKMHITCVTCAASPIVTEAVPLLNAQSSDSHIHILLDADAGRLAALNGKEEPSFISAVAAPHERLRHLEALAAAILHARFGNFMPMSMATQWAEAHIAELLSANSDFLSTGASGRGLELVIQDIDQQARKDRLTGLLNRHALEKSLADAALRAYSDPLDIPHFSLAILDIDLFKSVNDTYGHNIGDEVIRQTANVISHFVRSQDVVGRWGGEEFLLVFHKVSCHHALDVADRLRKEIERRVTIKAPNSEIVLRHVTASIGLTEFLPQTDTEETAIKRADEALYDAKKAGRNQVVLKL